MLKLKYPSVILAASPAMTALPAAAMDCSKAKTTVETAICSDDKLKRDDASLSKIYFGDLKWAKDNNISIEGKSYDGVLLDGQREWIAKREKTCGQTASDGIKACIAKFMKDRYLVLTSHGPVPPDGLTIGTETLVWKQTGDGIKTLEFKGRVIVEVPQADANPPFTILQRWSSPETQAVLLKAGEAVTMECSTTYVIEARKNGNVTAHKLGQTCIGFDTASAKRTENGFVMEMPVSPVDGGTVTEWDARSGARKERKVQFQPRPGTKMREFTASAEQAVEEPLSNAEFYEAATRLPAADRQRIMTALWQVANDCSHCGGLPSKELYGLQIEPGSIAYSGCGWYMNGATVLCRDDDALAVWDSGNGRFYFAVAPHREDGHHSQDGGSVHFYPPLAEWSETARAKFEMWQAGNSWAD